MSVRILNLAVALTVVFAVACNPEQKPVNKSVTASTSASPSLVGTDWLLTDLAGTSVIANSKASIAFLDGGRAAGNGSCNRFTGAFATSGDVISLGPFASTRMACMDGGASSQEDRYLKILAAAKRYEVKDDVLLIYPEGADKPLRFSRQTTAKP